MSAGHQFPPISEKEQERMLAYGEWIKDTVLAPVPHRQYVFALPRLVRPYFRYHRACLGQLCRLVADLLWSGFTTLVPDGQPAFVLLRADLRRPGHFQSTDTRTGCRRCIHAVRHVPRLAGRMRLARYMTCTPFVLDKMTYDPKTAMINGLCKILPAGEKGTIEKNQGNFYAFAPRSSSVVDVPEGFVGCDILNMSSGSPITCVFL